MSYRLPPLNALRAFEAAARHLSFSKAAEELFVTPAAISHQIKALEEHLGVQLFRRLSRSLALTEAAQNCLPKLREGFDCLAGSVEVLREQEDSGILTASMPPALAAKWLVPRLDNFMLAHPEIEMRIAASSGLIDANGGSNDPMDLRRDDVDIAIRFGNGDYPGYHVERMLSLRSTLLCSPRLLKGRHPLRAPADLRHHTLLHSKSVFGYASGALWRLWLARAGVEDIDVERGPWFSDTSLAIEAALDGQGATIAPPLLMLGDIVAGRLVMPFDVTVPLDYAYWIVCPEHAARQPKIVAFSEWLHEEVRNDEAMLARLPPSAGATSRR